MSVCFHRMNHGSSRLVFDVGTCTLMRITEVIWDLLEHHPDSSPDQVRKTLAGRHTGEQIDRGLADLSRLREQGYFTGEPPSDLVRRCERREGVYQLSLVVSGTCNMRCDYCFAESGSYGIGEVPQMSFDVARAAVDLALKRKHRDGCCISFFGGEPLLNFDVIKQVVAHARSRAEDYFRFSLTTNGTLLTREMAAFLAVNRIGVLYSLDGPEQIHDRHRKYPDGRGSFNDALANRNLLLDAGAEFHIGATLSRRHLESTISANASFLAEMGPGDLTFSPCLGHFPGIAISEEDLPCFREQYLDFARKYVDDLLNGNVYRYAPITAMFDYLEHGKPKGYYCPLGQSVLVVLGDGRIFPCERLIRFPGMQLGDVWRGITSTTLQAELATISVDRIAMCADCWLKYQCGGGCPAEAFEANGSFFEPNPVTCEINRVYKEAAMMAYDELLRNKPQLIARLAKSDRKHPQTEPPQPRG